MSRKKNIPFEIRLAKRRENSVIYQPKTIVLNGKSPEAVARRVRKQGQEIISIRKVNPDTLFNIDKELFI